MAKWPQYVHFSVILYSEEIVYVEEWGESEGTGNDRPLQQRTLPCGRDKLLPSVDLSSSTGVPFTPVPSSLSHSGREKCRCISEELCPAFHTLRQSALFSSLILLLDFFFKAEFPSVDKAGFKLTAILLSQVWITMLAKQQYCQRLSSYHTYSLVPHS